MIICNIYYERYLFLFLLLKELLFTYTTGCMFLFYKKEVLFFIFTYLDIKSAFLKALSFIDLKPLGAFVAEKQQSEKKNSLKVKTSRA